MSHNLGRGKTTFARELLPAEAGLPTFVNADLIASGLSIHIAITASIEQFYEG